MSDAKSLFTNGIHPRALFGPSDIPTLRDKASRGIGARAVAGLRKRCEPLLDPASPEFLDFSKGRSAMLHRPDIWGSAFAGNAAHNFGWLHLATGERRYTDAGIEVLRLAASVGRAEASSHYIGQEGEFPLAFDLLAGAMSAKDRAAIADYLRHGMELLEASVVNVPVPWGVGTNTFLHGFEEYVLLLAVTYRPGEDEARMANVAELARRSIQMGTDQGGLIGEGPSYGAGDAMWLSTVAEILLRLGVCDLYKEEPNFANLMRQWAYLILPGNRGQNTPGDAWRLHCGRPLWAAPMHARRFGEDVYWWVWEQMRGRGSNSKEGEAPEAFYWRPGWTILYEDDQAVAKNPGDAGWPTARMSGDYGLAVMRSGWGEDDVYFSLSAAGRRPGTHIHQHMDAGHFTLAALGEMFSIDTGYGDFSSKYHSLVIPSNREPEVTPDSWDNVFFGGRMEAFAHGRTADYARADVQSQWRCRWAYRHAMLVRGPHADPYVLLLDDYNRASAYTHYLFLINTEPGNRIELDKANERVAIHGRRHRLDLAFSHPGPADYPIQHRIELNADEIDSNPLGVRDSDVNYFTGERSTPRPRGGARWGAGVRPRLTAELWGYNGLMLTALVPRRQGSPTVASERLFARGHFGMTIRHDTCVDTVVANAFDQRLDLGGVKGVAPLAVVRRDTQGKLLWWAAADARHLMVDGVVVLPRQHEATPIAEPV